MSVRHLNNSVLLEYYTQPGKIAAYTDLQLGSQFRHHGRDDLDLRHSQIALIGLDAGAADAIRERLFGFAPVRPFQTDFVDLGNTRKDDPYLLIPLLRELLDARVQPIVLGGDARMLEAQFRAHEQSFGETLPALVLPDLPLNIDGNPGPLNEIWLEKNLEHLALLGYQQHRTPTDLLQLARERRFDLLRLGNLQSDPRRTEPLIRQADFLHFDLGAVRAVDAPAQLRPTPAGLTHPEACQLFRYAGMSDRLRALSVVGYAASRDEHRSTAEAIAQYLWYYLEGCADRKGDYPASTEHMIEYVVQLPEGYEITFWKSERSGRWWFQLPEREKLVPCYEDDYGRAANGELPDRWIALCDR